MPKYCEHFRHHRMCVDCMGSGICEHSRQRQNCLECNDNGTGGTSICEHRRQRPKCKECGGGHICEHLKQRDHCGICSQTRCEIEGCALQGHFFAGAQSLRRHMQARHGDNPKGLTKRKELDVHQCLTKADIQFEYQYFLPFKGCGLGSETAHCFADFCIAKPWGYILVECDEDQHGCYDPTCDTRRDFDMAASVALGSGHRLVVVRFNPDSFRIGNKFCAVGPAYRQASLVRLIAGLDAEPDTPFQRLFMFYDRDSPQATLPSVAKRWPEAAKEVSRCVH